MMEIRTYPSDEGYCDDAAPVLQVFFGGNLDWYVAIEFTDHRLEKPMRRTVAVRITTSGSRIPGLAVVIKKLFEKLGSPEREHHPLDEKWIEWSLKR